MLIVYARRDVIWLRLEASEASEASEAFETATATATALELDEEKNLRHDDNDEPNRRTVALVCVALSRLSGADESNVDSADV